MDKQTTRAAWHLDEMQTFGEYRPTQFDHHPAPRDQSHWIVLPVSRTRDTGPFYDSNFETALKLLGGRSDDVQTYARRHWGPGWYEIIIVRPNNPRTVRACWDIYCTLENYPVLDDQDLSAREWDAYTELWDRHDAREFRQSLISWLESNDAPRMAEYLERDEILDTDAITDDQLREVYEALIPSGEYYLTNSNGEVYTQAWRILERATYTEIKQALQPIAEQAHKALA